MAEPKGVTADMQPRIEAPVEKMGARERGEFAKMVREAIQDAWSHDRDNREESATDLAFLAGHQWPETVKREREAAKRPMLTINRLPQFVRQITNDIRQADLAIKVVPEDDTSDPKLAKIYDGLIRQIQYRSSAKHVFATAAEHQAGCGIGFFRVTTRYVDDMAFDQEIILKDIPNPLSVYVDPAAVMPDRSDASWIAITEMMPRKSFEQRYPKASVVEVAAPLDQSTRPFYWASEDGIRVCEYWWKEPTKKLLGMLATGETVDLTDIPRTMHQMLGVMRVRQVNTFKIKMALVSGSDVLEGPFDWPGKYIPIVPVIGGEFPLDHRRYRYSVIRFARDAQQLYNYYRTATAEAIALAPKAPYVATPQMIGPFKAMWDTAHQANRPYLLYEPDPSAPGARPQREHPPEVPAALMQEASIASDDMKGTTGIYDAALGQRSNETAGIAIRSRQVESDVANYHFADNLQRGLEHAGRILVDLIPKIYDNERVVRLLAEDGQEEPVRINQVVMDYDGVPVVINDLSAAAFDIRVTIGRSYATKRLETADSMIEFMKAIPGAAPIMGDLIAKALDFPDADVIAKRLKNTIPPAVLADPDDPNSPPPPDPQDDPMVQAELRIKAADAALKEAQAMKAEMEAAQLQQAGIQPTVADPEVISPEEAIVRAAGARKAIADADLADLNVERARREMAMPTDDQNPELPGLAPAFAPGEPPQGESTPAF